MTEHQARIILTARRQPDKLTDGEMKTVSKLATKTLDQKIAPIPAHNLAAIGLKLGVRPRGQ